MFTLLNVLFSLMLTVNAPTAAPSAAEANCGKPPGGCVFIPGTCILQCTIGGKDWGK